MPATSVVGDGDLNHRDVIRFFRQQLLEHVEIHVALERMGHRRRAAFRDDQVHGLGAGRLDVGAGGVEVGVVGHHVARLAEHRGQDALGGAALGAAGGAIGGNAGEGAAIGAGAVVAKRLGDKDKGE